MKIRIALVGDYSPGVIAHQAIPRALELAAAAEGRQVTWDWRHTASIPDTGHELDDFAAVWVVPASPYARPEGALSAIRWARENRRPLLASCGGFQHLLIEFARHCAGIDGADHGETNPAGDRLVVAALACSLVEQEGPIRFSTGSLLRRWYGRDTATEGYHCRYGLNAAYRAQLEAAGLRFTAFDDEGEIRGAELPAAVHPFFVGTLFQSERAALRGEIPPLARALVRAAAESQAARPG
ncbi:MAG: synthase [Verrucomicrobia bacterium]|nr:synthase [Verrucomicrobiota bacterium]